MGRKNYVHLATAVGMIFCAGCDDSGSSSPSTGEDGVIDASGSGYISGAIDEASWDAMISAEAAKDQVGEIDLAFQHRIAIIDRGTRVKVIEGGFAKTRVRILSGIYLGDAFWVPAEFVRKQPVARQEGSSETEVKDNSSTSAPEEPSRPSSTPFDHTKLRKGDHIAITSRSKLYFYDSFYRYAEPGEAFEVLEYRPEKKRLYVLSKDKRGKSIALNLPDSEHF